MFKNVAWLSLFLLLTFYSATGQISDFQQEPEKVNKNVIYGTVGFFPIWGAININYERMIAHSTEKFLKSWWYRAGGGVWGSWGAEGPHFVSTIAALTGSKNSHFEAGLGFTILNDNYYHENSLYPAGNIGYRFQKPDGRFVFRTGAGFPETTYLSLGISF